MSDHGHGHGHGHDGVQADVLDLDAEAVAEHTASIIKWLPTSNPRQIVDLGSGTGAGTFALLAHFPEAHVTAVDASIDHLQRLQQKACELGLTDHVSTVQADLDTAWPDLGKPDLVWASASLHHLADPVHTLRQVHDTLAPDGLLAVVELAGMPRFLPDNDLEERLHAAGEHRHRLPHRGADWGPLLTAAGFTIAGERTVSVHIEQSELVTRYALAVLQRMRDPEVLSAEDLEALDHLIDSIPHRTDLVLRTERKVWAAKAS